MNLPAAFVDQLREIFPAGTLALDEATRRACGDHPRSEAMPDAVVFPPAHEQVVALVGACKRHRIPLTARGRGSITANPPPRAGGIAAGFERMDRIVRIEPTERMAIVEPGVLTADLQDALDEHGLFWPPVPFRAPWSTVGDALAGNAGGPHAVKYGASRDNVLGLRVVAGNGAPFRCGARTANGVTGYDLAGVIVGSEGTLALITEATLKLTPKPAAVRTLRAAYTDLQAAGSAVARIMAQPVIPRALELMDAAALQLVRECGGDAPADPRALLLIEIDGEADALDREQAAIEQAARGDGLTELRTARDDAERATLWAVHQAVLPAVRARQDRINEEVMVPVSRIPELVACLGEIASGFRVPMANFGHAGGGNLHVNLLPRDAEERARAEQAAPMVFAKVIELGGTLPGARGIGIMADGRAPQALDSAALAMMRGLKALFDPENILNPGTLLPEERGSGPGDPGSGKPAAAARISESGPQGPGVVVHGSANS